MSKKPKAVPQSIVDIMGVSLPDAATKFEDVIRVAIMTPLGNPAKEDCIWGLPIVLWGLSGIAKTDRIEQVCSHHNLPLETILPAQHAPEDFSSVLVSDGKGGVNSYATLPGVIDLIKAGRGVLFFDEASGANPTVQGAMLGTLSKRRCGNVRFPPKVRVLAAANPAMYSAGGWEMTAPMSNRFGHFYVSCVTAAEFAGFLVDEGAGESFDTEYAEGRLLGRWNAVNSNTKGQIAGFVRRHQGLLHRQPLPDHPEAGFAWPSPRSWYFASRAVSTIRALGMDPTLEPLFMEACVGEGPAAAFATWVKQADLPLPEQVLLKGWEVNTQRLDITMAVMTSVSSYVVGMDAQDDERTVMATAAWKLIQKTIDANCADVSVPMAKRLTWAGLGRRGAKSKELREASAVVLEYYIKNHMLPYVSGVIDE